MDLANMTVEELQSLQEQIAQRSTELLNDTKRAQRQRAIESNKFLKANGDVVMKLVKHNEECDHENGFLSGDRSKYCPACHLQEIVNGEWMDDVFEVVFTVNIIDLEEQNNA